jgi:polyhydroxyalkanoate synthase
MGVSMGFDLLHDETLEVVVDREERANLRVEHLGVSGEAPLVVERVTGATTGGPPVLLVHGLAQNRFTWRVKQRSMSGFLASRGYVVYNVELRGHGRSRAAGSQNATGFADYISDVAAVVDAVGEPPFAIGHSLGGGVLAGAATRVPLRGLVHLAGVFAFATQNPTLRALARLSLRLEPLLMQAPVRARTGWVGDLLGGAYSLTDLAGYGLPLAGWVPGSIERDLLEERLTRGFDWTSVEVWLEMARWATGEPFPWASDFAHTDVPLLVIAGDQDRLLSPEDARRCFEASGSRDKAFLELNLFDHGSHFGHLDLILGRHAPVQVWGPIVAWLEERR